MDNKELDIKKTEKKETSKKINMKALKDYNKKFNESVKVELLDGKYYVNVKPIISSSDREDIVLKTLDFLRDESIREKIKDVPFIRFILFFTTLNQSDLLENIGEPENNSELLELFTILLNCGFFTNVLEAIDVNSMEEVYKLFNTVYQAAVTITGVEDKVENSEN